MSERDAASEVDEQPLPFDIRTVLLSLRSRWRWFLAFGLAGCLLGVAAGLLFGSKLFVAETLLLYRPNPDNPTGIPAMSLKNQGDMVRLETHLERARERLGGDFSARRLRRVVSATVRRNSEMLSIEAAAQDPVQAAKIANAARDGFLAGQKEVRKAQLTDWIGELVLRQETAEKQRDEARQRLEAFRTEHDVLDPTALIALKKQRLTQIDSLQREAETEIASTQAQVASMEQILAEAGTASGGAPGSKFSGLTPEQLRMRLALVQKEIEDDRTYRSNLQKLAELDLEVKRTSSLVDAGIMAQDVLDRAIAAYDAQRLLTEETEQVQGMKNEVRAIQDALLGSAGGADLGNFRQKTFDIRLTQSALEEKIKLIAKERKDIQQSLALLGPLEQVYKDLTTNLSSREEELRSVESMLSAARQERESPGVDFTVISVARPPGESSESNRRFLAAATAAVVFLLGCAVVLAQEAWSVLHYVRSAGELSMRAPLRFLGALPEVEAEEVLPTPESHGPLADPAQLIARRIRHAVPKERARLLITSPGEGAGRTTVAIHVARALADQGDSVALIDADSRSLDGRLALRSLVPTSCEKRVHPRGANVNTAVGTLATPTGWERLSVVPPRRESGTDLPVGGERFALLLEALSRQFDVVVLDGPPVLRGVDAERLAEQVDAIVFVARAGHTTIKKLNTAVERLATYQLPVVGAILNGVQPLFLEEE